MRIAIILLILVSLAFAQPVMKWQAVYGHYEYEYSYSAQQTADGGYILAGTTNSIAINPPNSYTNIWLVKTDENKTMQWNKTIPGLSYHSEEAYSVQQTSDGGYIIAGFYNSVSYDDDAWLIKTNSTGDIEWNRTFDAGSYDYAYSVQQTSDGGYILAGYTRDLVWNSDDFWLIKTNSSGEMEWNRTFGGLGSDYAYSVQQTSDGGYILLGEADLLETGDYDLWLVKTNSSGDMEWNRSFGGTSYESAWGMNNLLQTPDNGYIIAGRTQSFGAGGSDAWVIKTDPSGQMEWNRTFGGSGSESFYSVRNTSDGGYIIAGETNSFSHRAGYYAGWLIKTNSSGDAEWNITLGCEDHGYSSNGLYYAQQTSYGYMAAGYHGECDATEGSTDFWLVKFQEGGPSEQIPVSGCNETFSTNLATYYLTQNVSPSGYDSTCFEMEHASNIILDCRGYSITPNPSYLGQGIGVSLSNYDRNITVKNCNISNFDRGIYVYRTNDSGFENNTIWNSSSNGFEIGFFSENNVFASNRVFGSGGSGFSLAFLSKNNSVVNNSVSNAQYGIYAAGNNSNISNNNLCKNISIAGAYFGYDTWYSAGNNFGSGNGGNFTDELGLNGNFSASMDNCLKTHFSFILTNRLTTQLYLQGMRFDGRNVSFNPNIAFAPLERKIISFTLGGLLCDAPGDIVQFNNVMIFYKQGAIDGMAQVGSLPLMVKCS